MLKAIFSRIGQTLLVVFLLVSVCFFCVHALPGNPFSEERDVSDVVIQRMEASYGLDKPKVVQYLIYWKQVFTEGNLGESFNFKGISVNTILGQSFPVSFQLGLLAMISCLCGGSYFTIMGGSTDSFS